MLYKVTTAIFMTVSVIFASLYFVEMSTSEIAVEASGEMKFRNKTPNLSKKVDYRIKENPAKTIVNTKTVVLKEVVESHPGLEKEEVALMLEIKNSMSRDYSRRLEREHPLLFERLQLDYTQKEDFKLLIGERRLGMNLRPAEGATEEEKEQYKIKKEEILSNIDDKITEVLGEQTDAYFNYRDKSQQYQVVFDLNRKLESSGEKLELEQQDQLADLMHISRKQAEGLGGQVDWRQLRESPEKAASALADYKERQDLMKSEIGFLSDVQKDIFIKHLDSRYKRYESWVNRINRGKR